MKYTVAFTIVLFIFFNGFTQDTARVYNSAGIHLHYGFIIPHADEIEPVSHTNPAGVELNYYKLNTSFKSWKVFSTFWQSGIQAGYYNFMNPGVVGSAFTLTAFAEPFLASGRKYIFSLRGGAGISYHTRIYDTIENPANKFFANRISFPVYISARLGYRVASGTLLTLAGNYNHISNGGMKQPNYGMNYPTLSLGLQYFPRDLPDLKTDYKSDLVREPGIILVTQLLSAYKVVDETDEYPEKGAFAIGFHVRAAKQLSRFYSLNAGGEIILDRALRETIRREGAGTDYKRVALTAGQDFLFGNAIFTQYFGFYVYSPRKAFRNIYQKYELSYRISKDVSAGAFLKAHLYVAELMGLQMNFYW